MCVYTQCIVSVYLVHFCIINHSFRVPRPLWILDHNPGRKQQGGNEGQLTDSCHICCLSSVSLRTLMSLSNKMGRPAGRRLHIVLAEEAQPHASLISDYDCGVFNSGCTAISQPRGRRIIVFSEWLSANTVHRWAPLIWERLRGEGILLLRISTGTDEVCCIATLSCIAT